MLSALLRQTLDDSASTETTLQRELDVIDRYMKIQHVRFEDKLQIEIDVADAARPCAMPPLLLHALVENAVKHGLRTADAMPVAIRLSATYDGDALRIEVRNSGKMTPRGNGVGLRNITDRLDTLYPGRHSFAIVENGNTVRATMEIRSPRLLA
jgi:LytS/YehU family sensor histidine kinase